MAFKRSRRHCNSRKRRQTKRRRFNKQGGKGGIYQYAGSNLKGG